MIRIDVERGEGAVRTIARAEGDVAPIRIGRVDGNDLVLDARFLSSEHARVAWSGERYVVQDLKSTNGTAVVRRGERLKLDESNGRQSVLEDGDVIELGVTEDPVVLRVSIREEVDGTHVVAVRSIDDLRPAALLGPLRGEPAVDRAALAAVVSGLGRLITSDPGVRSVDCNPLIIGPGGRPVAVDALVELAPAVFG